MTELDDCGHLGPKFKVDDELSASALCAGCIADEIEMIPPGGHVVWRIEALPYDAVEAAMSEAAREAQGAMSE